MFSRISNVDFYQTGPVKKKKGFLSLSLSYNSIAIERALDASWLGVPFKAVLILFSRGSRQLAPRASVAYVRTRHFLCD